MNIQDPVMDSFTSLMCSNLPCACNLLVRGPLLAFRREMEQAQRQVASFHSSGRRVLGDRSCARGMRVIKCMKANARYLISVLAESPGSMTAYASNCLYDGRLPCFQSTSATLNYVLHHQAGPAAISHQSDSGSAAPPPAPSALELVSRCKALESSMVLSLDWCPAEHESSQQAAVSGSGGEVALLQVTQGVGSDYHALQQPCA